MSSFVWQVYSPNTLATYMPNSNNTSKPTQQPNLTPQISQPSSSSKRGSITTTYNDFSNPGDFITYIIPDFQAVKYFQREFVKLGEFHLFEESEVTGFEIYLVDQWVNNRNIGTVVTVYTGNESSKISVVRFTIIKKPSKYYPSRFQAYLNELIQNHSRMKKMDNERRPVLPSRNGSISEVITSSSSSNTAATTTVPTTSTTEKVGFVNQVCFVTNLTSLPSNLNLIPIPQGDVRKIESSFIINSNLRKLHCTGRSISLISDKISDANEGKFRQMYKIYNVPVKFASRELINIIQTCLFYFDLLDARYCNGLLCAKTEEAINNWWNLIGLPHFNVKPNKKDGILPAMTVAAIISLILSVRLRIQLVGGCDVPKDPFDFESFMIAIGQFQRQYKLEKTRKLDMETLNRLFTITNSRLLPEKHPNYFYSSAYGDNNLYEADPLNYEFSPPATKSKEMTLASLPKRKYGKELKKFTNVVKTTVQGINAASKGDLDENPNKPNSGKIMNRIAKLADMSSPLDVETLDLEYLVKNYLTGKVLIRLFYGVQITGVQSHLANMAAIGGAIGGAVGGAVNAAATTTLATADKLIEQTVGGGLTTQQDGHQHHHHHHNHNHNRLHTRRRGRSISDNTTTTNQYVFESLRDKIANTQELALSTDYRYSKGFNFKRFGLQSKRNLTTGIDKKPTVMLEPAAPLHDNIAPASLVDSFLQIQNGDTSSYPNSITSNGKTSIGSLCGGGNSSTELNHPIIKFQRNLNRRNSFPFILNHEANLNSLVVSKVDTKINPHIVECERKRPRSFSCSIIEDIPKPDPKVNTISKLSQLYLKNINTLMKYENLRKLYFETKDKQEFVTNKSIDLSYQLMNLELVKLNNLRLQMDSHRLKIMDEDISDHLQYNMNLLTTTIDRLVYETRIVVKRIDELEDNYQFFEMKNDDCQKKMSRIIDNSINSKKFKLVYPDLEERKQIIIKLKGDYKEELEDVANGWFKIYIMMIYDFILNYLQIFRANMNVDRIRDAWGELDPNRTIINKAYSYFKRQSEEVKTTEQSPVE